MNSLFHFEDKVHLKGLQQAGSIPLLFPRLLFQVLEHIGFPAKPRIERGQICDVVMTPDRARSVARYFHLRPIDVVEDDLGEHHTKNEQPSQAVPAGGEFQFQIYHAVAYPYITTGLSSYHGCGSYIFSHFCFIRSYPYIFS